MALRFSRAVQGDDRHLAVAPDFHRLKFKGFHASPH